MSPRTRVPAAELSSFWRPVPVFDLRQSPIRVFSLLAEFPISPRMGRARRLAGSRRIRIGLNAVFVSGALAAAVLTILHFVHAGWPLANADPLLVSAVYRPLRALGGLLVPGYAAPPPVTPAGPFGQDVLLDAALLIVANLSLVVALVALWRLYEPELGAPVAVLGCGLLLTAPNAFFLSAGFSESSIIAATALTFLFAQRGRWLAAGAAGAAACLVRLPGVWLLLPLAVLWLLPAGDIDIAAVVNRRTEERVSRAAAAKFMARHLEIDVEFPNQLAGHYVE